MRKLISDLGRCIEHGYAPCAQCLSTAYMDAQKQLAEQERDMLKVARGHRKELQAECHESQSMVATLREALEIAQCAIASPSFPSLADSETLKAVQSALSSTADAAKAHDERVRREEREAVLKTVTGILFRECQPNNGDLFSRMDDELRTLARDGKP